MNDPLLSELINSFLNQSSKSTLTTANYRRYLSRFLGFTTDTTLSQLTSSKLQNFKKYLALPETSLAITSQNYHLSALRELLKFANLKFQTFDPSIITLHPIPAQIPSKLTSQELSRIQDQTRTLDFENLRDKLIIELLSTTGIKVSELVALNREDVYPNLRQITVRNGSKIRTLLLPPSTALILESYLKSRHDNLPPLLIRRKSTQSDDLRLNVRTIQRTVKSFASQTHIPDTTPTKLRNQFAATLFSEGLSTSHANKLLGHHHESSTAHIRSKLQVD